MTLLPLLDIGVLYSLVRTLKTSFVFRQKQIRKPKFKDQLQRYAEIRERQKKRDNNRMKHL